MTYASVVAGDSPVAWWKLNETSGTNAADSGSGTAANGTYSGTGYELGHGGIDGADVGGGTSVLFASSGYVSVGSLPSKLQFASGTAFSIECWAAWTATPAGPFVTEAYAGDGNVRYMLGTYDGGGFTNYAYFGWYNGAWRVIGDTSTALNDGSWHHIVGTFDGTQLRLYVDGALVAGPTTPAGTQPGGTETLYIARRWDSGAVFGGFLDEVAMYSAALTGTQVSNHYAALNASPSPLRATQEWIEAEVAVAAPALRVTQEWLEAPAADPTPELRVTDLWLEVAFKRDYCYLDGTIVVEDANEDLDLISGDVD